MNGGSVGKVNDVRNDGSVGNAESTKVICCDGGAVGSGRSDGSWIPG